MMTLNFRRNKYFVLKLNLSITVGVIAANLLVTTGISFAKNVENSKFKPMHYSNNKEKDNSIIQSLIYQEEIKNSNKDYTDGTKKTLGNQNAPFDVLSAEWQIENKTIFYTVALTRKCDNGANNFGSEIEPSQCPAQLTTIEDGKIIKTQEVKGCFVGHIDPDVPSKNKNDETFYYFDTNNKTLYAKSMVGGKYVSVCNFEFKL